MRRELCMAAIWALVLMLLTLVACGTQPETPSAPNVAILLGTPVETSDQATLEAALTQEKNNADIQAGATAAIERANAQATLNSANATLSAAQTQEKNNTDIQAAATAAIERANSQATLNSASSTQNAALNQDAIRQTQAQFNMEMTVEQQNKDEIAARTQTAVANIIATQTQSALATSQWYTDQARQRDEQNRGPITFVWMWCLPIFIVLLAGLVLWGFWRWLKDQQANQRIHEKSIDKLQPPAAEVTHHQIEVIDSRARLTKPGNQVRQWLDEVKRKLPSRDKKDEDDNTDN